MGFDKKKKKKRKEMGFDKKVRPAMRSFSNNYDFSGVNDVIRQKEKREKKWDLTKR